MFTLPVLAGIYFAATGTLGVIGNFMALKKITPISYSAAAVTVFLNLAEAALVAALVHHAHAQPHAWVAASILWATELYFIARTVKRAGTYVYVDRWMALMDLLGVIVTLACAGVLLFV